MAEQQNMVFRKLIGVVGILGVLGFVGFNAIQKNEPRTVSQSCTIKTIDPASRTIEVSFNHPRTGENLTLSGNINPECQIIINGKPAKISELKPGDNILAQATIMANRKIVADKIELKSRETVSSSTVKDKDSKISNTTTKMADNS